jgi:hypothetical protein
VSLHSTNFRFWVRASAAKSYQTFFFGSS